MSFIQRAWRLRWVLQSSSDTFLAPYRRTPPSLAEDEVITIKHPSRKRDRLLDFRFTITISSRATIRDLPRHCQLWASPRHSPTTRRARAGLTLPQPRSPRKRLMLDFPRRSPQLVPKLARPALRLPTVPCTRPLLRALVPLTASTASMNPSCPASINYIYDLPCKIFTIRRNNIHALIIIKRHFRPIPTETYH